MRRVPIVVGSAVAAMQALLLGFLSLNPDFESDDVLSRPDQVAYALAAVALCCGVVGLASLWWQGSTALSTAACALLVTIEICLVPMAGFRVWVSAVVVVATLIAVVGARSRRRIVTPAPRPGSSEPKAPSRFDTLG